MKGWMNEGAVAERSWRWLADLTMGVAAGIEVSLAEPPEMLARVLNE